MLLEPKSSSVLSTALPVIGSIPVLWHRSDGSPPSARKARFRPALSSIKHRFLTKPSICFKVEKTSLHNIQITKKSFYSIILVFFFVFLFCFFLSPVNMEITKKGDFEFRHVFSTSFNNKSKYCGWNQAKCLLCVFFHVKHKKKTFLAVLTWFLISGKIQGGGQDGYHCWSSHRPPAVAPPLKYTSSCFSTKGKSFQNTATYQNPWEAVPYTAYNRGSLNAGLTTDDKKANDYGVGFRIVIPLFMTSAKKIFGKSFEKFYLDCIVKRCGCQITARPRTDARYEAITYSKNQALKTRD